MRRMTEGDAYGLVELEIGGRMKNLSDATRSDWVRAVVRAGDAATAREIIRELADDPEENWLTTKGFYRRLYERNKDAGEPQGKCDYVYGDDGAFEVVAQMLRPGMPDWCMKLAYPTDRRWGNGVVRRIEWTEDRLRDAMQPAFRRIRATYGGDWVLSVWAAKAGVSDPMDRDPGARDDAERKIMAGPDTPGRRWLLANRGKPPVEAVTESLPEIPPASLPVCASQEMIDRLRAIEPPAMAAGPIRFDPDNDPELQDRPSFAEVGL